MSQQRVVLLLGSNLGNLEENIQNAVNQIEKRVGKVEKKSKFIYSEPVEFVSKNIFCNIATSIHTDLSPMELLSELKSIENEMGRLEDSAITGEYRDRIIDIDIVSYGNMRYISEKLVLPHHKHLYERAFSRQLLNEIFD